MTFFSQNPPITSRGGIFANLGGVANRPYIRDFDRNLKDIEPNLTDVGSNLKIWSKSRKLRSKSHKFWSKSRRFWFTSQRSKILHAKNWGGGRQKTGHWGRVIHNSMVSHTKKANMFVIFPPS